MRSISLFIFTVFHSFEAVWLLFAFSNINYDPDNLITDDRLQNETCVFQDIFVEFFDGNNRIHETIINGCIEAASFPTLDVRSLEITEQFIPFLGNNSIRDFPELETVTIISSWINVLAPGAFQNLPKIKNISLVFNNFTEVKRGVFNYLPLKKILLSGPSIEYIEEGAFANMKNLKVIGIHYCQTHSWNKRWFTNTQTIEVIDWRFGKLEVLPADAFEDLPNLKQISFRNSHIHTVEASVFQGLTKLKYLGLNSNNLSNISADAFSNSTEIDILNIEKNRLNFLSQDLLERITTKEVYLWGNPWTCSCFDQIQNWLAKNNGSIYNNYNCIDFRNPTCIDTNEDTCAEVVSQEVTRAFARKFSNKGLCVVPVPFF